LFSPDPGSGTGGIRITSINGVPSPTVSVEPSDGTILALRPLSVGITVSQFQGEPVPAGTVAITSGTYTSPGATLDGNGSASITIPAGSLPIGSDMLTVAFTPATSISASYSQAWGTAMVTVNPISPQVAVTMTASPEPVPAGTSLTYTVAIHNNGPTDAKGVVLNGTVPEGVTFKSYPSSCKASGLALTCNLGTIVNGSTTTFTFGIKIPPDFLSSNYLTTTQITSTVTITSSSIDENFANEMASVESNVDSVSELDLTVASSPNPVAEGGVLTYNMTFRNKGPSDAIQGFILVYTQPGISFVSSSVFPCGAGVDVVRCNLGPVVPVGFTATIPIQMKIPSNFLPNDTPSGSIVNAAEISSSSIDPKPGSEPVSTTTIVTSP